MTVIDAPLRCGLAALTLLCAAALPAQAQLGWAVGIRSADRDPDNDASGDRRGYEARVMYDREFSERFGWRVELGYNQMQFQRTDGALRFQVSENGFEVGVLGRFEQRQGALTGLYAAAGPVLSFRAACGASGRFDSNGRVACDEGETFLTGVGGGLGYRWPASDRTDVTFEARYLRNVTAAQGRELVAFSIGIRGRGGRQLRGRD